MKALAAGACVLASAAVAGNAPGAFQSSVSRIPPDVRERVVGSSWRPDCPVPLRRLRLVRVSIHKFDDSKQQARLIVHRTQAHKIVRVFHKLWRADYPIRRMRLVDAYGADDDRSMKADNTSAFNCRFVAGTSHWSMHAYGKAIDLNPVENPYVGCGRVHDPSSAPYVDRSRRRKGMVTAAVVRAFRSIGWGWGGEWSGATKDYMHFSTTGH